MNGDLQVQGFKYVVNGLFMVQIQDVVMAFFLQFVDLCNFKVQLGKSDLQVLGCIDNFLAYFFFEKIMIGQLKVCLDYFDIGEWMFESEEMVVNGVLDIIFVIIIGEIFDCFDF